MFDVHLHIVVYNTLQNGRPVQVRNNPRWPRFSEFVDYLILEYQKRTSLDMHWTPITEFCSPCQVDFDMILKFDTLDVSFLTLCITRLGFTVFTVSHMCQYIHRPVWTSMCVCVCVLCYFKQCRINKSIYDSNNKQGCIFKTLSTYSIKCKVITKELSIYSHKHG